MGVSSRVLRVVKRVVWTLAVLVTVNAYSPAEAATLSVYQSNGGRALSFFLRGDALNNGFNGVAFKITGNSDTFGNLTSGLVAGVPRPAGHAFTYRNRALDLDPFDPDVPGVGKGWTILAPIQNASEISFGGGPLGSSISTAGEPRGELFLANVFASPWPYFGALSATLTLVNGFDTVFRSTFIMPLVEIPELPEVPEPNSTALLITAGLTAIVARRRRM